MDKKEIALWLKERVESLNKDLDVPNELDGEDIAFLEGKLKAYEEISLKLGIITKVDFKQTGDR